MNLNPLTRAVATQVLMGQEGSTQLRRMAANSRRSHSTGFGSGNLWLFEWFANKQRTQYIMIKSHFSHSAYYYILIKKEGNTQPIVHIKVEVQSGKVYSQDIFEQFTVAKPSFSCMGRSEDSMHTYNLTYLMMEGICWIQGCTQPMIIPTTKGR